MNQSGKTIGVLSREYAVPEWKVRRVADTVAGELPRVGLYRVIPPEAEKRIRNELCRTGWLKPVAEAVPSC